MAGTITFTLALLILVSTTQTYSEKLSQEEKFDLLEKKLQNNADRLSKLESKCLACDSTMYSFSTRLNEDVEAGDSAVIFGTVDLNIGDGYDEFTGVFTAPQSGLYMLSVYASPGGSEVGNGGYLYIKKNGNVLCQVHITVGNSNDEKHGVDTNSCTAVAELTPEDSVRVTGHGDNPCLITTYGSGFVGHMIQPYS